MDLSKSTKKSIRFSKYNVKRKNQLFYLKLVKKFYDKYKVNNYYPHFDTPIYLASYLGQTINSNLMKKIIGLNYNYFKNFYSNLKDFLYSIHYTSFIIKNENTKFFYDKVIITWAFKRILITRALLMINT